MKFKLIGGNSPLKTLSTSDHQIIWRIAATTQKPHLEITRAGQSSSVDYDLSGLTLESGGDV